MKKLTLLLLLTVSLFAVDPVVTDFKDYQVATGMMPIKNKKGESEAEIYYVSYKKKAKGDRPITFCFNGGPGAASAWLHLGIYGPKRVAFSPEGIPLKPYRLEENPYTILDQTDLVFIDPVSTGHSKTVGEVEAKMFHGVEADIKSIAEFIRQYLTINGRWGSPKFIAGESYGTTRAAGLANALFDNHHITIDGIILISCILDFQAYRFELGNDTPFITFLPTYAAINWYHSGQKGSLEKVAKEAEKFALGEYGTALLKGNSLSDAEKKQVAEKLSNITGIDAEYIARADLRVDWLKFAKKRFEKKEKVVSRFDRRFLGYDEDVLECHNYNDPTLDMLAPAFTSGMNQYFYNDLNWKEESEYDVLANVRPWDYSTKATNKFLNMNGDLVELFSKNPDLKIFVANGYFDLATPFMASTYTFNHLPIAKKLQKNITFANYPAGHMMYIKKEVLVKLSKDSKAFITDVLNGRSEGQYSQSNGKG